MNDWKPGDVAMVRDERGTERVAVRTNLIDARHHWAYDEVGIGRILANVRPLVVIDPEDREAVERLLKSYHRENDIGATAQMQAALREFAAPKPPKPDEPTGLGAVVEDDCGDLWVLYTRPDNDAPWCNGCASVDYADIAVVRVLSEGVS